MGFSLLQRALVSAVILLLAAPLVMSRLEGPASAESAKDRERTERAKKVIDVLQLGEQRHYTKSKRYTSNLGDIFQDKRVGTQIAVNLGVPLDVYLNVSRDGQTLLLRVNGPTVTMFRAFDHGAQIGKGCEMLIDANLC
jgi:hypothetical protein